MNIKKRYFNGGPVCEVTFNLPFEEAEFATTVHIVGEFNGWDIYATPMKKLRDGTFTITIDLEREREYQYRYLVDFTKWEDDHDADKYTPTPFGDSVNSVVVV